MRLEPVRKSSYKQASIFLICSGLVPQSLGIELAMFRLMGIKAIDVKSIILPESDARVPCSEVRSRIWKNLLSKAYSKSAKLAVRVMSMPATACVSERSWTQWAQVYVKARSNLGFQRASDMICINQNDRLACGKPVDLGDLALTLTMDAP